MRPNAARHVVFDPTSIDQHHIFFAVFLMEDCSSKSCASIAAIASSIGVTFVEISCVEVRVYSSTWCWVGRHANMGVTRTGTVPCTRA
jgi:hypothetical protein